MRILIASLCALPAVEYGGIERVIWCLGKELVRLGHQVAFLVSEGSRCDFAPVIPLDRRKSIAHQIPDETDLVHFHFAPPQPIHKPYLVTMHGHTQEGVELDKNTVFLTKQHSRRYGSECFVHNGLDWKEYGDPEVTHPADYFHFLGKAAWRIKNVKGAIQAIGLTKEEKLIVIGGHRVNFNMGFRVTFTRRAKFCGMVGGEKKNELIRNSRGLIFPVRWHEPFGLAVIESLYLGCPVFGTPYGSMPELVRHDVGFLTDSASELAEAIENYRVFSRKTCHAYALQNFNSGKMTERYLQLYDRVLSGEILNSVPPKRIGERTPKFLKWSE